MTLSPAQLGLVRTLGTVILFSVLSAVLGFLANAVNLTPLLGPTLAAVIAAVAGSLEQHFASQGNTALFGAVSKR